MPFTERKYVRALPWAEGSADRSGAILDMSGQDELDVIVSVGDVANSAVTRFRIDSDSDVLMGSPSELDDTNIDIIDDRIGSGQIDVFKNTGVERALPGTLL